MKILLVHNHYQQPGGEDHTFQDERWLLESRGHEVVTYTVHNDVIPQYSGLQLAMKLLWNGQAYREVQDLIRRERPDLMHCTNVFPLVSPAIYYAARREAVPVVQSLHNFRLLCPNALLLRQQEVCEDCLGKLFAWPAIQHACYRQDRLATTGVATMLTFHRLLRTWSRAVNVYFTLTEMARSKFVAGGLPPAKIVVKPNFVRGNPTVGPSAGGYAVFVGRLSPEKGIEALLNAWARLPGDLPLHVVGDGPLAERVANAAQADPRIVWHGRCERAEVEATMGNASMLLMPSICYETFGRTITEAYALGVPVIASGHGAMAELVQDGITGALFPPGDAAALAAAVMRLAHDSRHRAACRTAAREAYELKYTAEANYEQTMAGYQLALGRQPPLSDDTVPSPELTSARAS